MVEIIEVAMIEWLFPISIGIGVALIVWLAAHWLLRFQRSR